MSLSPASFDFVRATVRERSAHSLDDDKSYLVETRLHPVARRHGFQSVEELVQHLIKRSKETLLRELVEAMTINETSFFRDGRPFEILRQAVIPELIQRRASTRSLNIWSAACSTGQEIYSVAILLRRYFPVLANWNIRLIASDLSTPILERARLGRYSDLEVSRGMPPDLLHAYFHKQKNGWQIQEDLRRMVEFRETNLNGIWPALPLMDLILLRNVLIYFDISNRRRILDRIRKVLQPDGYLMLGGAETTHNLNDNFVPVSFDQTSFFRLRPQAVA